MSDETYRARAERAKKMVSLAIGPEVVAFYAATGLWWEGQGERTRAELLRKWKGDEVAA